MFIKSKLFKIILQRNKASIGFIYFLNILEEVCYVLIPSALGFMINSFIYGTGYGIWAFLGAYLGWQGIATLRKIVDTITFTKIYNQICFQIIEHHKQEGIEVSKINGRIELLKQIVSFFENDLPSIFKSIVSIFGAAVLLFFYNPVLLFICLIVVIPSFTINYFFGKKMVKVAKNVNDQYEKQIDMITHGDMDSIKNYFAQVRQFNIRKSSLEAYNFGLLEIFCLLMIVTSIYFVCKTPNVNYGDIVASYGIILRFAYGFDFIPHVTERLATLKDIQNRIEEVYIEML